MKKLRNKILSAVLVLSLLLTSSSFAFAVDGEGTTEEPVQEVKITRDEIASLTPSSQNNNTIDGEENIWCAFDGVNDDNKFWHTSWNNEASSENSPATGMRRSVIIELKEPQLISKFVYYPRSGDGTAGTQNGRFEDCNIYTGDTIEDIKSDNRKLVGSGNGWENNADAKTIVLEEPVFTKYIMIEAPKTYGTDKNDTNGTSLNASALEIELYKDMSKYPTITEQPKSAVYGPNDTIGALTVSATDYQNGSNVSYQWHEMVMGENGEYIDTEIGGATNSTYTPTVTKETPKYYYVIVTDSKTNVSVKSDIVTVAQHDGTDMVAIAGGKFYDTFTKAVEGAYAGGTVWVLKDFTLSNNVNISKELTIRTIESAEEPATITRGNNFNGIMFTVATTGNLTLDNIIIDGGAVWGEGNTAATASGNSGIKGGALVKVENNGDLTVKADATLQNNENISSAGGAISADADGSNYSNIHVYGKILNNKVIESQWNNGGGIASDGDLYIYEGAVISGNFAPQSNEGGEGGGIQIFQAGSLYLYGGTIKDNRAGQCNNISFGNSDSARKRPVQLMGNVEIESINLKNKNAADTNKTIEVVGELSGSINVILGNGVDGDTIATINENVNKENILSVFKVNDKITYLSGNKVKFGTEANYSTNLTSEKSIIANPDGTASTTLTVETTGTDVTYKWYKCSTKDGEYEKIPSANEKTLNIDRLTEGSTYYYCVIDNGDESTAGPKTSTTCEVKVTDFYPCSKAIEKFKSI